MEIQTELEEPQEVEFPYLLHQPQSQLGLTPLRFNIYDHNDLHTEWLAVGLTKLHRQLVENPFSPYFVQYGTFTNHVFDPELMAREIHYWQPHYILLNVQPENLHKIWEIIEYAERWVQNGRLLVISKGDAAAHPDTAPLKIFRTFSPAIFQYLEFMVLPDEPLM